MSSRSASGIEPSTQPDLAERLDAHVRSSRLLPRRTEITVALSGGLDSIVLLDLLVSLSKQWSWRLSAAHFDHRMRADSETHAEWVLRLCDRLSIPTVVGRAHVVPAGEAEARELRYRFLQKAREDLDSTWLATAHQADDQAETVLFRVLRGSGLVGLSGIPHKRAPGIVRPLLPFWRTELEAYADSRKLGYLTDPSNLDLRIARNRIRHELIPAIEAAGESDFRRQLVRLSGLARRASSVVGQITDRAAEGLVLEAAENRIVVARTGFLAYDTNVRAHLLRALVARVGPLPDRVGTRTALEFINSCSSGRSIDLAGGVTIRREFDRVVIERRTDSRPAADESLEFEELRNGERDVTVAGVRWRVRWKLGAPEGDDSSDDYYACFDPSEVQLPLAVRSWLPGDRIRLNAGTRKLKKVFAEAKIGRSERGKYPLLVDRWEVLWIVGLLKGVRATDRGDAEVLSVSIRRAR
jgi:tRNA(Ile)-lysidine synthase